MSTRSRVASRGELDDVVLRGVRPLGGPATDLGIRAGLLVESAGRSIDCTGLIALPAFVDLHTHLREPGGEDAETIASGTAAAAAGGYADVLAMANCSPVTDEPERVTHIRELASATAACRVHPVGAITTGLAGTSLAPIDDLAAVGVRMFSDDGKCVDHAGLLREALRIGRRTATVIAQHAQHGELAAHGQINEGPAAQHTGLPPWPAVAEETVVARDVIIAGETGGRLHVCHVSTAGTVEIVRWAKARGWPVTAEVTPHHLLLDDQQSRTGQTRYKVNPPLRTAADVAALRAALADGTIDAIATDHAPHSRSSKARPWREAPFGMTGLETALAVAAEVLLDTDGRSDWATIADRMAHRPARIAGLGAIAGRPLRPGEPATLTLVKPDDRWWVDPTETAGKSANTPFARHCFHHRVVATIVEGHVTYDRHGLLASGHITKTGAPA
jgi:dihydroorotase